MSEGSVRVQCRVDPIPHWFHPLSILAFLVIRVKGEGAKPVYKLYGKENIGYHIREGGHAVIPYDWNRYLSFLREHNKGIR